MKKISFIILILTFGINANAYYSYMSLPSLVCKADYAAIGTIVKLDKSYFYLKVDDYLLNKLEYDTLKIQKFKDWSCGIRYDQYAIGQREIVFFKKSNYVIEKYDLIGYGGGSENELLIKGDSVYYSYVFGKLKAYSLLNFITAIKDYDSIKQYTKTNNSPISKKQEKSFASRSDLHRMFIECRNDEDVNPKYDISPNAYMVKLEKKYLYKNYENKLYIYGYNINDISVSVEDADVWKKDNYFIIMPKDGDSRRWVNVFAKNNKVKKKALYTKLLEVIEIPEPTLHFNGKNKDTINVFIEALPRVNFFLDNNNKDDHLKYQLLCFTYTIHTKDSVEVYEINSSHVTLELNERVRKLKTGDRITISKAKVLYPNNTVHDLKGRTVTFDKTN